MNPRPKPRGPRLHWAEYIVLAACAAMIGAIAGRLFAVFTGKYDP